MSEPAKQLQLIADRQIAELIDLVGTLDDTTTRLPCHGREKLGDGTVGASAQHTADNYQRIARFIPTSDQMTSAHEPIQRRGPRTPSFLRGLGHRSPGHGHSPDAHQDDDRYTADQLNPRELVDQLSATRELLGQISTLSDTQLEAIPPDGSFRFCDGQRTLEQVLASLLKHQDHQINALTAALAPPDIQG